MTISLPTPPDPENTSADANRGSGSASQRALIRHFRNLPAPLHMADLPPSPHQQKHRRGMERLFYAFIYSLHGLWETFLSSPAFRMEVMIAIPGLVAAFWLGDTWAEIVLLCIGLMVVLIAELLNSGIEAAIDRIGYELHPLSKMAKDMGSAAVFLAMMLCLAIWVSLLYVKFAG